MLEISVMFQEYYTMHIVEGNFYQLNAIHNAICINY